MFSQQAWKRVHRYLLLLATEILFTSCRAIHMQPVTCFAGCNNFPCSNRCESHPVLSYHSSVTFQLLNIVASYVIDIFHVTLTFTITTENHIKTKDENKDCISYLQIGYMHLYSLVESAIKSIKIFKL